MPSSFDDFTQISENFGSDPVVPRGYGRNYNDTAYPFYPGPRPALDKGQTDSWFYGESLDPDTVTLVLAHPASPGRSSASERCWRAASTRWGAAVAVPAGASSVTSPHPAGQAIGLSVQVLAGSLPSQRPVISVAGHPYELAGSLSSAFVPGPWQLAGFSEGYAVFTLRKPSEPITATTANGRRLPVQVIVEHDEVRRHSGRRAGVLNRDPFRRVGFRLERHRLGQRRRTPRRSRSMISTSCSRSTSRPATMWSRSTTDHRTSCWPAFSAWARSCCSWRCSECG